MAARQRLVLLLRKFRLPSSSPPPPPPPPRFTATSRSFETTTSSSSCASGFGNGSAIGFGCAWRRHSWGSILEAALVGQAAIFLSLSSSSCVFAEDDSVGELATESEQGEAYVSGLRRVEDGSVISNEHTIKWRIFTDNGREFFLKGKLDEAEKFFQSALHEAKEGFGPRDPHVASSCNNLAELYRIKKEYEKAEPLYLEAIRILEESFGADDIRVGAALHNLGQYYHAQRKLNQARTCYERALKIEGRVLGYGHPDYANTMYHLGKVLYLQGKEKDGEALIRESIRILEEAGLGESPICIRRMSYLSQNLLRSNRLAEAENLQRKILHNLELSNGWDSLETTMAAEALALTLQSLGNLRESQELLERCLAARKKILPEDHVQVASNLFHLANLALLNSKHLRKASSDQARTELDKAKLLLNNSIRISKGILTPSRKALKSLRSASTSDRDQRTTIIILLQALDAVGLLEVTRHELLLPGETSEYPHEAEQALRECVSLFKEPHTRSILLSASDVRGEYLACLSRLTNIVQDNAVESQRIKMQDLIDDVKRIEAELTKKKKMMQIVK